MLIASPKRVKALSAPTGFGKTAVYVAYALLSNKPTCFVTDNRGLQDQLMRDYAEIGLVDIRGRRNYTCDMRNDYTCEEGYSSKCPHKGSVHCPASAAEMRAAVSPLVVTNYDKWTASRKFGMGMEHFTQVVFDEGHRAPDALARAMQVILHSHEVEEILGLEFPHPSVAKEMVNWKQWASFARAEAESLYLSLRPEMERNPPPAVVKRFNHARNLSKRLATLASASPENWIVDEVERGYQFDPIRPGRYAESALLLRVPTILVVSATLRPKTLFMLGIGRDHFEFREFDSDFDPARCPIYHVPTMRVDVRAGDLSMLWVRHDQIAAARTDRKGIVHTISYARRDEILKRSRFAPSMIINAKGEASTEIVEQFKMSPDGTILVSPSVGEGFDFPGPECEWQFACKIPFPDSRSKIVKARQADDKEYGAYIAAGKLEQIFGRGMRSKEDQCEGFIPDDHVEWFVPRFRHLFSRTFTRRFSTARVLPQPPVRL
jgi:Rad3-related DNA helicase